MVRARVTVSGRVQGVFFRATCAARAAETGVSGWARNLPDGSVEAVFEGAADAVAAMIAWCREGPPHASVREVSVTHEEPAGERGFRIR